MGRPLPHSRLCSQRGLIYRQHSEGNQQRDAEARTRERLLIVGIMQECDQAAALTAKQAFGKVALPLWRRASLEYLGIDAKYGTKIAEYMPLADYKTRGLDAGLRQSNDAHDETDEAEMAGRIYVLARNEAHKALGLSDEAGHKAKPYSRVHASTATTNATLRG